MSLASRGLLDNRLPRSALPVIRKNVVSRLHVRVARESAFGVVPLRRLVGRGTGPELTGRGLIHENGPTPPAAVREPLALSRFEPDGAAAKENTAAAA